MSRPTSHITNQSTSGEQSSDPLRLKLINHPIYESVQTADSLRVFMREHAFAVWDFMSLLKRLQQIVTCCEVPWMPRPDATLARFINEIVLGEECDEDGLGGYASHFDLYLSAMREINANTQPIQQFIADLKSGLSIDQALDRAMILETTRDFVRHTMQLTTHGSPHEVAAAFFYGREDIIPDMFSRLVERLPSEGVKVGRLTHYLQRHIELDANDHGPLAAKLVNALCDNKPDREAQAQIAAQESISKRIQLWDGILAEINRS